MEKRSNEMSRLEIWLKLLLRWEYYIMTITTDKGSLPCACFSCLLWVQKGPFSLNYTSFIPEADLCSRKRDYPRRTSSPFSQGPRQIICETVPP